MEGGTNGAADKGNEVYVFAAIWCLLKWHIDLVRRNFTCVWRLYCHLCYLILNFESEEKKENGKHSTIYLKG